MKRSISEIAESLRKVYSITPWEKIEVGKTYHIPPIGLLERRDVVIISKDDTGGKYKRVDISDDKIGDMHKTSAFAKFLIEKKSF